MGGWYGMTVTAQPRHHKITARHGTQRFVHQKKVAHGNDIVAFETMIEIRDRSGFDRVEIIMCGMQGMSSSIFNPKSKVCKYSLWLIIQSD